MAKLSLLAKDATKGGGFSAQEGLLCEISKAYSLNYKFPPNEDMKAKNEEYPTSTQIVLELIKLNPQTQERLDDEPIYERLGFGGKNGLDNIRPGKMDKPDQAEPKDLGRELGTEGNSIYAEPGTSLADNCAWIVFSNDLQKAGFDPDRLGSSYLPYLEGTKFEVRRHPAYKKPGKDYKTDPTNLGVKRILVYGYESGQKTRKGNTAVGKGASSSSGNSAQASGTNGQSNGGAEYTQIALEAVKTVATSQRGKPQMKRALFQAAVMTYLMKNFTNDKLPMKAKNDLMNQTIKDDGWLAETAAENAFVVDFGADDSKGMLEFPQE